MTTINKKEELEQLRLEIKEISNFIKTNNIKLSSLPTFKRFNYSHYYYYFSDKKNKSEPTEPLLINSIHHAKAFKIALLKDLKEIYNSIGIFLDNNNK